MIKSHIQSNKGSTLAMMILVIGILVILGTALLTATYVGVTAKLEENRKMTAMYMAEAGLDEAYGYLGEEVENASEYSRKVYVSTELINNPQFALLDDTQYKNQLDILFKKGFKKYFIDNEATLISRLQSSLKIESRDVTTPTVPNETGPNGEFMEVPASDDVKIVNHFSDSIDAMTIDFTTKVRKKPVNGISSDRFETLKATLQIQVPSYQTAYYKEQKALTILRNALFDKAVAIDGDFYVMGGSVTVDGNLYAQGTGDLKLIDPQTMGGVVIGGEEPFSGGIRNSGRLTVTGNLDTARYARIASSQNVLDSNSSLTVNGNITCNSLVIQDRFKTNDNSGATVLISGDASVFDDTELNAAVSSIQINGNYFGFSNGSTGLHDQSSGIIINAEDINSASSMTLLGAGTNPAGKVFPDGKNTLQNGIYLAGSVYINQEKTYTLIGSPPLYGTVTLLPDGSYKYVPNAGSSGNITDTFQAHVSGYGQEIDLPITTVNRPTMNTVYGYLGTPYQTGDSLSVIGNYLAYGRSLVNPPNFYKSPDDYTAYDSLDATYFTDFTPLNLVELRKKRSSDLAEAPAKPSMSPQDKAQYAMYVSSDPKVNDVFNLGLGRIFLSNVKYTLGTYISRKDGDSNKGELKNDTDIGSAAAGLASVALEYNYKVNALSDPQQSDYLEPADRVTAMANYPGVRNWLKDEWNGSGVGNVYQEPTNLNNQEVLYVKSVGESHNEPLILCGTDYDPALLMRLRSNLSNPVVISCASALTKGVILAHGDIYCIGKLNYKGLLLTDKNVYCLGSQTKTFTNLGTSVAGNYIVEKAFDGLKSNHSATEAGFWFKQDPTWTVKIEKLIGVSQVYNGSTELGYPASLAHTISVTRWHRDPY